MFENLFLTLSLSDGHLRAKELRQLFCRVEKADGCQIKESVLEGLRQALSRAEVIESLHRDRKRK
jgi:hypothetical protein